MQDLGQAPDHTLKCGGLSNLEVLCDCPAAITKLQLGYQKKTATNPRFCSKKSY